MSKIYVLLEETLNSHLPLVIIVYPTMFHPDVRIVDGADLGLITHCIECCPQQFLRTNIWHYSPFPIFSPLGCTITPKWKLSGWHSSESMSLDIMQLTWLLSVLHPLFLSSFFHLTGFFSVQATCNHYGKKCHIRYELNKYGVFTQNSF